MGRWSLSLLFFFLVVPGEFLYALTQSWSGNAYWLIPGPPIPTPLEEAEEAAKVATVTSTALSIATVTPTSVAQGSRAFSVLQMLACGEEEGSATDVDEQTWLDNPLYLSLGNSTLKHHTGAVVGNWVVLGGVAAIWKGVVIYLDKQGNKGQFQFPGGLIIPVAFLFAPTTTSAMTLVSEGNFGQRFLGVSSLCGQVGGMIMVTLFLMPENFHAALAKDEWVDSYKGWLAVNKKNPLGYVNRFGLLFDDYRPGRQWYIGSELLMSSTTGLLKSYQIAGGDCKVLLWLSAVNSAVYAVSIVMLYPHRSRVDRIFYGAIAVLQATALTVQAIAESASYNSTIAERVRPYTESIVMATEWALLARCIYDIYGRTKDLYHYAKNYFAQKRSITGAVTVIPLALPPDHVPRVSSTASDGGSNLAEPLVSSLPDSVPSVVASGNSVANALEGEVVRVSSKGGLNAGSLLLPRSISSASAKPAKVTIIPRGPSEIELRIRGILSRLSDSDKSELDKKMEEIFKIHADTDADELEIKAKAALYTVSYPVEDEKIWEIAKRYPDNKASLHRKIAAVLYDLVYVEESDVFDRVVETARPIYSEKPVLNPLGDTEDELAYLL